MKCLQILETSYDYLLHTQLVNWSRGLLYEKISVVLGSQSRANI